MPALKISDEDLLQMLSRLFQDHGYDGASLSRIMQSTGLVKASLYHRFAGGKEEMAAAVLARVSRTFAEVLLAPLGEADDPAARLRETGDRLAKFYGSGGRPCLLDTMTLNQENAALRDLARGALEYWLDAFARFARECGLAPEAARQQAEDAVAAIEGGLVLARVSGDRGAFLRAIESLPDRLMKAG
jgi:AcrR family transcriptional regulator